MTNLRPIVRTLIFGFAFATAAVFGQATAPATSSAVSGSGAITGRVYNPATGEYIRNAEIHIEGTQQSTFSEDGGYYRLLNAPAGDVTLVATYTGHESVRTKLNVTSGATAMHDFELAPTDSRGKSDEVLKLTQYVVSTEREGQAKAIAEQRNAMNVKNVMSADNFGDMSEGNVGEFLKYLPGIVIDYVETDTRAARMGGMDAKYGYVTLDGNTMASGNSGSFGGDTRQFEFESISMNNIESIEVNKTLSADMWGDAPAGTVNLRTRSALDLKRAKYGYSVGYIANSYEHGFKGSPRHDDGLHDKARPRGSFDYTNSFLDHKLGITLNGAFTSIYKEQFRHGETYDYTSTQAIAAGHPLITAINFKDGPKISEKSAGGLKIDYAPFPDLRMSVSTSYAYFGDNFANRNLNFRVSAANIDPSSTLTKVIALPSGANSNTRIEQTGTTDHKMKDNTNIGYAVNWKTSNWTLEGNALYSRAREHRGALLDNTLGAANVNLTRIGWTAERPSVDSPGWSIIQTSGPDWQDMNNYGKSDAQTANMTGSQDYGITEEYTGRLDATRVMGWKLPTSFKFGVAEHVTDRSNRKVDSYQATWIGPTGNQLTSPLPASMASFWSSIWGGSVPNFPVPDKEALGQLRITHPEYFLKTEADRAKELNDMLSKFQSNQEEVKAAYFLGNTRIGGWRLQAGVRYEGTRTIASFMNDVPPNENPFATVTTTSAGVKVYTQPTTALLTRDYVNYRWSRGKKTVYGEYRDFLPSLAAKYSLTKNLNLKLGYNKSIKRPDLDKTNGPIAITTNATTGDQTATVPNPDLQPEHAERYSMLLEYYFEPAGTVSVHVFQTNIKNEILDSADGTTADDAGFGGDPSYDGIFFKTYSNLGATRRYKGIEIDYNQQLTFFKNEILRGFSVGGSFSHYSVHPRIRDGKFFPYNAVGKIGWRFRRFNMQVNATWTDETFTGANSVSTTSRYFPGDLEYLKPRTIVFVNASYKLRKNGHTSVFVSGDRAYDSGKTWFYKSDGRIRQMERYGSQWSIGLRGDY